MQYKKTITIPEREEEVIDKTECDICGQMIKYKTYKIDEVTVSRKTGDVYPESGLGSIVEFDICGDCFEKKLIPFFESFGCKARITDWDY